MAPEPRVRVLSLETNEVVEYAKSDAEWLISIGRAVPHREAVSAVSDDSPSVAPPAPLRQITNRQQKVEVKRRGRPPKKR